MTPKRRSARKKATSPGSTTAKTTASPAVPAVPKVAQPHGGALNAGGTPGNKGGTGRPRSQVRDDLLGTFDTSARPFLESVVRGDIVSKIRVPLLTVTKHLTCPNCGAEGGELVPTDAENAKFVEVQIEASATIAQRVSVAELMAKYGVGQMKELTADSVRERLAKTLDILQAILSPEQFERSCKELEPVWR